MANAYIDPSSEKGLTSSAIDATQKKKSDAGLDLSGNFDTNPIAPLYANSNKISLTFPYELASFNAAMALSPIQNSREDRFSKNKSEALAYIFLPIPSNLSTAYNAKWGQTELGVVSGAAFDMIRDGNVSSEQILNAVRTGVAKRGIKLIDEAFNVKTEEIASGATRSTFNPHYALIFSGNDFRTYSFRYRFIAREKAESDTIRNIISTLKYYMSPGYSTLGGSNGGMNSNVFSYPALWDIKFLWHDISKIDISGQNKRPVSSDMNPYLFQPGLCAMTGLEVSYGTEENTSAFFKESGAPVTVSVSMSFMETEVVTRESITAFVHNGQKGIS